MVLKIRKVRKDTHSTKPNAMVDEGHIDLDAPLPPQERADQDDVDEVRRGLLGKGLLALAALAGTGLVGADVGARIRKTNDRESTTNAVNGLVAEARRVTAKQEQSLAMSAMVQAQTLISGLRRAAGQTTIPGHVLNGSVTWETEEGPVEALYPVAFLDDAEDPSTTGTPRWVATPVIDDGMITFNLMPVGDDAMVTLNSREALQPVDFYTISNKGGGDEYRATALWASVDGQTAWRQPGDLIFPKA
jgi:hypothetical protein